MRAVSAYFAEVWDYRYFWYHLVQADLQKRYRRSLLGIGWSLLQPLAMTTVLMMVYTRVLKIDFWAFAPLLLSGLAFWALIQQSVLQGCGCFVAAEPYLRQQPLPTVIFPLRVVLTIGTHFLISLGLAVAVAWWARGGVYPLTLVALVPVLLLLFLFVWGLATVVAYAHVYLPDTQHLMEVGLQVVFYLTPIIYPPHVLEQNGLGLLLKLNPLTVYLQVLREPLLTGGFPPLLAYVKLLVLTVPVVAVAMAVVARLERKLIFAM